MHHLWSRNWDIFIKNRGYHFLGWSSNRWGWSRSSSWLKRQDLVFLLLGRPFFDPWPLLVLFLIGRLFFDLLPFLDRSRTVTGNENNWCRERLPGDSGQSHKNITKLECQGTHIQSGVCKEINASNAKRGCQGTQANLATRTELECQGTQIDLKDTNLRN